MFNKHFFGLLALIIIIGFAFGFFTSGKRTVESEPADNTPQTGSAFIFLASSPNGLNFEVSQALANAFTDLGFATTVSVTGNAAQNMELLLAGRGQFAIATPNREPAADADKASATQLKAVMVLWYDYGQVLVNANGDINRVQDLAGRKIAINEPGSRADNFARALLTAAGIDYDEAQFVYTPLAEALQGLEQGTLGAVVRMDAARALQTELPVSQTLTLKALSVDNELFGKLKAAEPYFEYGLPPAGMGGLGADMPTAVEANVLFSTNNVDDAVVYALLNGLLNQKDVLGHKYPVLQTYVFNGNNAFGVSAPLHEGAIRYAREKGLIP